MKFTVEISEHPGYLTTSITAEDGEIISGSSHFLEGVKISDCDESQKRQVLHLLRSFYYGLAQQMQDKQFPAYQWCRNAKPTTPAASSP